MDPRLSELPQAGRSANENGATSTITVRQTLADSGRAQHTSELVRKNRVAHPNPEIHCEYQYRFCQPAEASSGQLKNQAA
jgi:hypothetical protein